MDNQTNQNDQTFIAHDPNVAIGDPPVQSQEQFQQNQPQTENYQQPVNNPDQSLQMPAAQMQHDVPTNYPGSNPKKSRSKFKFVAIFLVLFMFLGTVGTVAAGYGIATGKLNVGSEKFQQTIAHLFSTLPFAPVTPKTVLEKALIAHSETKTHSFDISASVSSDGLIPDLGLSSLDMKLAGVVDYNDLKNINFEATVDVTNKFQATAKKVDTVVYGKIEKLPTELLSFVLGLGADTSNINSVLENWVKYDITPLDSEARKMLEEEVDGESYTSKLAQQSIETLLDEQILSKMEMTKEDYEGTEVYLLSYSPNAEDIDYLFEQIEKNAYGSNSDDVMYVDDNGPVDDFKLSEIITKLEIKIRIGVNDNLMRWSSFTSTIEPTDDVADISYMVAPYVDSDKRYDIAFVMKLDKFNEDVNIEVPKNALTFEEYMQKMFEAVYPEGEDGLFGLNPGRQFAQSRDTQRQSELLQITNAVYQFASENDGNLPSTDDSTTVPNFPTEPTCIGSGIGCFDLASAGTTDGNNDGIDNPIVPTYISSMPLDPSYGVEQDSGYTIYVNANGRVVAEAVGELTDNLRIEQ